MSSGEAGPRYASVAVPVPVRRLFTYRVGASLDPQVSTGTRVRVPFGPRKVVGTVVEWPAAPPDGDVEIRAVESVVEESRRLPRELLELTRFVADYYLCSWGEAIEAALPPDAGPGRIERHVRLRADAVAEDPPPRATAQQALLQALRAAPAGLALAGMEAGRRRAVRELVRRGLVEVEERRAASKRDEADGGSAAPESGPRPTQAQAAIFEQIFPTIDAGGYAPCLLFGATGSGKTEVYLRAAERTLQSGRGVLYLVPEIGLTPLLLDKVSGRFPGQVALLHSGLSRRRRHEEWESVRLGRRRVAVGTRSAVFAPLSDVGLIVVDEEQDGSYKQEETPRYNARDLAVVRASRAGAMLLLGSATPSMESFYHARSGRYRLLRLGGRVEQRPLPQVQRVDMRQEYRRGGEIAPLSATLLEHLRDCVDRGEQALVLRNRRGWAAAVMCPTCGERIGCVSCSIAMTWHRSEARLRCHYCGAVERFPRCCPTCGSEDMKLFGEGSERIEDLLREALPGITVERMDRDTIRRRGAHEALLRRFDRGEIQVLVGTQMIAKGHDFPRVTLVGVLSADQALGLPDFRAGERVFQLLTQVAGRAGRGERPGTVLIQAFDPDHPLLRQAATQDFEAFFEREITYRRALRYPPLAALIQIVVHDKDELRAREWAATVAQAVQVAGRGRLLVGGPGPAPIERLKGRYRQQILLRSAGRRRLIAAVEQALGAIEGRVPRRALQIDVDPYSLL